ncbi:MAG: hypothetical protein AB8G15_00115 [Saprospiraceae bacterium]
MQKFEKKIRSLILLTALFCFISSAAVAQSWTDNGTNIYPVDPNQDVIIGSGTPTFISAYKLDVSSGKFKNGIVGKAGDGYTAIHGINQSADGWAGAFTGNVKVGNISNPLFEMRNATNHALQIGIASCNSCYDPFAKPGDAVFRMMGQGDMIFSIPGINQNRKIAFHTPYDKIMTIQEVGTSGKVGVGTTNFPTTIGGANISDYRLFVEGGILTDEVRVRTGWADYVFEENYELKSLAQVEAFIKENGHLPNVPSATTVETAGISIGDISKVQQEKIEELFLHMIELNKTVETLKAENAALQGRLNLLEQK